MKQLICAAALALTATTASAVTVNLNTDGLVTSVDGLIASGFVYSADVSDTRICPEIFSGCDEASDFPFADRTEALAAAQALFNVLFLPTTGNGNDVVEGLDGETPILLAPYGDLFTITVRDKEFPRIAVAVLSPQASGGSVFAAEIQPTFPVYDDQRFAVFSKTGIAPLPPISAVPLPASAPLLLAGLGFLGWRRSRKA